MATRALILLLTVAAATAQAAGYNSAIESVTPGGASATWIFANLSYTGMRAQGRGSLLWRVITFLFGFPGTLLTYFVVTRGSERAYGIDLPRKR